MDAELLYHVLEDLAGLVEVVLLVRLEPAGVVVRVRHQDHLHQTTMLDTGTLETNLYI